MPIRVKICGLTHPADAEWALACGADALGIVLQPGSPRCLEPERASALAQSLGPYAWTIAVFGPVPRPFVAPPGFVAVQGEGASHLRGIRRIETVRVRSVGSAQWADLDAEGVLLDAHDPAAYGGTGKKVDWNVALEIVAACPIPVILAGGLTPDNVAEAIRVVRPYGVDVSSGVESAPGKKDPFKVRDFIQAAKGALNGATLESPVRHTEA